MINAYLDWPTTVVQWVLLLPFTFDQKDCLISKEVECGSGGAQAWDPACLFWILAKPHTSCVTLGKWLHFSYTLVFLLSGRYNDGAGVRITGDWSTRVNVQVMVRWVLANTFIPPPNIYWMPSVSQAPGTSSTYYRWGPGWMGEPENKQVNE